MTKLKQKDRAVLTKAKLTVYIGRSKKKILNLIPTRKRAPKPELKTKVKVSFFGFVDAPVMCINHFYHILANLTKHFSCLTGVELSPAQLSFIKLV